MGGGGREKPEAERLNERQSTGGMVTIAIDGAMGTRLLAVALDFLSSAFVASSCHPSALLGRDTQILGGRVSRIGRVSWFFLDLSLGSGGPEAPRDRELILYRGGGFVVRPL